VNQIIQFASHRLQGIAGRSNNDVDPQFNFICFQKFKGFVVFPDINFIEKNSFERASTEPIK
jgi:hypothetical protein